MPENVSELYRMATTSMLKPVEAMSGASKIRELLEATFYQAHVAETRNVTKEHLWMAALNMAKTIKGKADWADVEAVSHSHAHPCPRPATDARSPADP